MAVSLTDLEATRLALQRELDGKKSQAERNRLGQFATPTGLADQVLRYARSLLPDPVRFLDPALGTGSFYSALSRHFSEGDIESAIGFEVDPAVASASAALWGDSKLNVVEADFLEREPADSDRLANLVVCNPPYVRHHHLTKADKARLQGQVHLARGRKLSGLAGLYCYFLLHAHSWMDSGALSLWLIPSEFLDVNYGRTIKEYLSRDVTLLRVHRFDPNDLQFDDALVSSVVVSFRNERPSPGHTVEFSFGGTLSDPRLVRIVESAALQPERKWSGLASEAAEVQCDDGLKLRDLFSVKRGLATGNNEFFIVSEERARTLGLPAECLQPILPSPRYLAADEIEGDEAGIPEIERRLFLINCRLPEDEVEQRWPALWSYLCAGVVQGVNETYLSAHRSPWYVQEDRPAAPYLITYMSRHDGGGNGFRFILNNSNATAANVYLMLYPRRGLQLKLEKDPGLRRRLWLALREITASTLVGNGRVYGGGLHKLEPKELGNVPADSIRASIPELADLESAQLALL